MSYTGQEIFNMAIAVIDELSDSGTVSDTQVKEYKNRATFLLDMWQHEVMKIENLAEVNRVETLEDELDISERGCISGVYYLAMHFALADQNTELATLCKNKYEDIRADLRIPKDPVTITDVYDIANSATLW